MNMHDASGTFLCVLGRTDHKIYNSNRLKTDSNRPKSHNKKTLTFQTSALPNLHAELARDVAHHKSRKTVQK